MDVFLPQLSNGLMVPVATGDLYNFFYITLVCPALDLQGFLTFMLHANAEGGHVDMKYS